MRTDTIETFPAQLAAKVPAPGGGATAADLRRDLVRATAAVDDLARRAEQLTTAVRDGLAR